MQGADHPIKHFEMMSEIADRLKVMGVQMLEATYSYRTFGSWWFAFQIKGENYRVVWDGKEETLRLDADKGYQAPFAYEWVEWIQLEAVGISRDALIQRVEMLIEKAKKRNSNSRSDEVELL